MKKLLPFIFLIGVCVLFFYKTFIFGLIPFPGDLLVSGYGPWRHQSYAGYVAGAVPSKDQYFDVIRELYPWKTLTIHEITQGIAPLWNPYNFAGAPLLANYQSQSMYPLSIIYYIFPQITAWTIMVVIQSMLGTLFVYMYTKQIGISIAGAVLSAVLFNFSAFASVWMEFTTVWHTILWLPLLLYLIEKCATQKYLSTKQQLLFIFGLFSAITGGHPQDFLNVFLFLIVYTIVRIGHQKYWPLLYLFVIPFFIAAPQLFPTIELFINSSRVTHDYQNIIQHMLIQAWQTPIIIISEFFGNPATKTNSIGDYVVKSVSIGVIGSSLALGALTYYKKSWFIKFFSITTILILLMVIRTPLSELVYTFPWPILSTGTPTRILFLLSFSLSILAGFGFDSIRTLKTFPYSFGIKITLALLVLWMAAVYMPTNKSEHAMIIASLLIGASLLIIKLSYWKKIIVYLLIPLVSIELFYQFIKFNPFITREFVFPDNKLIQEIKNISGIERVWGYGTAVIDANFATQTKTYSPDGTDPLNLHWYNRFIQSSKDGKIAESFDRTTRSDAILARGYGEQDLPENFYRLRIMDMMGVKYILDRVENPKSNNTFPVDRFNLLTHVDDWTVYENKNAAPRFFVTGDVRPYTDDKNFQDQFFDAKFNPSKSVLILQSDWHTIPKFTHLERPDSVELVSYTPTKITFDVHSDTEQFFFISDTYDHGWTAKINEKYTRVYRTNYAFRGIVIPKGELQVIWEYKPRSFSTGLAVSVFAVISLLFYFLRVTRLEKLHL